VYLNEAKIYKLNKCINIKFIWLLHEKRKEKLFAIAYAGNIILCVISALCLYNNVILYKNESKNIKL
jgi:hypothetical protein